MAKKHIDISLILLAAILVIFAGGVAAALYVLNPDSLENEIAADRPINTLFVLEYEKKPLCTYVLLYYPATKRSAVFDIAGETGILLRKINRVDRIDTSYNPRTINQYVQEIERLLDLDINYEIIFELHNLGNIVDLLEGVTIFIPSPVELYNGSDSVLFNSGYTTLDGSKTRLYLTYTSEQDDTETQRLRQERFFSGFVKRLGEKNNILKNRYTAPLFSGFIKTNMNTRTRSILFDEWAKIDTNRISIQVIGGNYRDVSGKRLLIPYFDGTLIKDIVRQTLGALTRSGAGAAERIFTVEVLNGTATAGLAARTAELIRGFGYDVIEIRNADRHDYEKTEVHDRSGIPNEAEIFASVINCANIITENSFQDENEILELTDSVYKADFTLIIGKDFNGRYAQSR
ncbi:MAG: LCP family protein [Spirochaetaceae bacterium]|jgi:anionic cell wall polymer biosynthesis LytR-Cps2A-Psr (LCP) family protein|nr:LCP family protein [Spirochaetaceae bacterium]